MESKTSLLCQILDCWYLDINFLMDLCDNNEIDIDVDDIKSNYWDININLMIYESIRQIAEKFIEEYREEISIILDLWDYWNLDEYISYHDLYEIYTNYMDSHLWFSNDKIQELFENSKYQV
jgi:hypothetical protein